ncbi:unnamed protein product [Microthlaspi erraticum]|uniref:Replication protein A 70 kDa DNA-binding subunit B/D first OB fold domain-containing protein n=1 Tax=Microthlaspi erraticum TaxID=1685480 RepID=A0A6D2HSX0_9BRAS|nr:unnamed protein product [Microthlaspi erraticum]
MGISYTSHMGTGIRDWEWNRTRRDRTGRELCPPLDKRQATDRAYGVYIVRSIFTHSTQVILSSYVESGTYKKLLTYDKVLRKRYTVSGLGPRTHDSEILVKVLRFWLNDHPTSAKRLELILSDEEGEKIQATVHVSVYEAYDCKVNEGDWILIKNFDVTTQTGHCRATWHLNRIYLMPTTIITKIFFASVRNFFNFVDFEKIIDRSDCDDYLVDLIGEVVNISESTIGKRL